MLKARLAGPDGSYIATSEEDGENRLHVATSPRYARTFAQPALKRVDNGQAEMAVNGLVSGASMNIWDGSGAGDTGADWTISGPGSETTGAAHSGTNGWDTGVRGDGDKTEFDTTLQALTGYDLFNFWLNPQAFPGGAQFEIEWRDANGRVGNKLKAENYVAMTIGSWQLVSIPLVDFALTSPINRLRFKYKTTGQHHFIDDVSLVASGGTGPFIYRMSRLDLPALDINSLSLVVAAGSTGWVANDFATINGGLAAGLLVRYWDYHTGEVFWSFNLTNNLEMFGRTSRINPITFFDSEHLVLLEYDLSAAPARVESTKVFDITVRDNLSTLVGVNAFATGGAVLKGAL